MSRIRLPVGFRWERFAFVAVILDCLTDAAKSFYQKWDFENSQGIRIGCSSATSNSKR